MPYFPQSRGDTGGVRGQRRPRHPEPLVYGMRICTGGICPTAESTDVAVLARDKAYSKVSGDWCCLYRAVDRNGQPLDFMLNEVRGEPAALLFPIMGIAPNNLLNSHYRQGRGEHGLPKKHQRSSSKKTAQSAGSESIDPTMSSISSKRIIVLQSGAPGR